VNFLDSNISLYGYSDEDLRKREIAMRLLALPDVCLSSQVVNEVMTNLLRKKLATEADIRKLVDELYSDYPVLEILQEDIQTASELREEYNFSYWDSLIVATALRGNADILYSEDMQDGLRVRNRLTIRNPFL
jgi:predicted nucleic acid-binding protein